MNDRRVKRLTVLFADWPVIQKDWHGKYESIEYFSWLKYILKVGYKYLDINFEKFRFKSAEVYQNVLFLESWRLIMDDLQGKWDKIYSLAYTYIELFVHLFVIPAPSYCFLCLCSNILQNVRPQNSLSHKLKFICGSIVHSLMV